MSDRYDELRAAHDAMDAAWDAHDDAKRAYRDTVSRLVQPGDTVRALIEDAEPGEDYVIEGVVEVVGLYYLYVSDAHSDAIRKVPCEAVFVVNDAHFLYDPDPDDHDDDPGNEPF